MSIFDTHIESLDGESYEEDREFNGSKLPDFTTVRRPDRNQLKLKYSHTQDKRLYMTSTGEQIHLILRDGICSRIRTERVFKGHPGEPLVEETTFGWVVHGGDEYGSRSGCMYMREVNDYEKLYSLDVLRVEDRGENDQLDVMRDNMEGIFLGYREPH